MIDHGEPETSSASTDRIHQEFRSHPGDYGDRRRRRTVEIDTQLEGGLAGVEYVLTGPHQRRQLLRVGMGRPRCSTIIRRPYLVSMSCTAVAPDRVFTFRRYGLTGPILTTP